MKGLRLLLVGIVVLVVGAVAGLWILTPNAAQKVPLPDGGEMHVLKVSLGTNHFLSFEPKWKQLARRLMPGATQSMWGAAKGERTQTQNDAMVVWLGGPRLSDRTGFFINKAEAMFTNGSASVGRVYARSGIARLTFQCFQRESERVPIRVWNGTQAVEFQVKNPNPVNAANWRALPVPQTQVVSRAEVVFKGLQSAEARKSELLEYMPSLSVRAAKPSWAGFVAWWHVTAFDRWGNYSQSQSGYSRYGAPSFAPLPPGRGPWRILVDGEEYLSAGDFPEPTNQLAAVVSPTPRMRDLGIRFLMKAGPGVYTITNGILASVQEPPPRTDRREWEGSDVSGGTNKFTTWVPAIFCLSEVLPGVPAPRMRIHEWISKSEGAISQATGLAWTNAVNGMKQRVQVFRPRLPQVFTNKYQVEVISDLVAEFFVEAPEGF